jgi:hypothetical protein
MSSLAPGEQQLLLTLTVWSHSFHPASSHMHTGGLNAKRNFLRFNSNAIMVGCLFPVRVYTYICCFGILLLSILHIAILLHSMLHYDVLLHSMLVKVKFTLRLTVSQYVEVSSPLWDL